MPVNVQVGLPPNVDDLSDEELRRALNLIIEILRTWNGELGEENRLVTKAELDAALS